MEKNDAVRMSSEAVDIFYRESEWLVQARFDMENVTAKNVVLEIGFPVERKSWDASQRGPKRFYEFKVRSGGGKAPAVTRRAVCDYSGPRRMEHVWSCWKQEFKPGKTEIAVEYRVPVDFSQLLLSDATWRKHVSETGYGKVIIANMIAREQALLLFSYILASGSMWRGRIGAARLTVHFPQKIAHEQVLPQTTPSGYVIGNDSVTWSFTDFEPQPRDDVRLWFLPFVTQRRIESLRERIKLAPRKTGPRLALARFILMNEYMRYSFGNIPNIAEAEKLLREALAFDPGNSVVWNTCLFYYHCFHPDGVGFFSSSAWSLSSKDIKKRQKDFIRRASRACPQDPGIRAWLGLIGEGVDFVPEYAGDLKTWSNMSIWLPPIHGRSFSHKPEVISLLLEFYERRMDPLPVGPISLSDLLRAGANVLGSLIPGNTPQEFRLVLKKRDLSPADTVRLTSLLRRVGFYRDHYAKQIWSYAIKTGIAQDYLDRKVTR